MNGQSDPAHSAAEASDAPVDEAGLSGLADDVRRLTGEARDYVRAELDYQSERARFAAGAAAKIALLGLIALVVAVFALGALVVGLLLALATVVGPWWATLIVAGGLAVTALAAGLAARSRFGRMLRLIAPRSDDHG
jgi:hypothetical protein